MSKILIVDDEQMMLMMARRILARKYDVITATTGAQAVELFRRERPDMVLSDLMMPEIDGYELQKILQALSTKPVPIMFMTADESEDSESKGFELGAADYIHKPFKPDVLLRRVSNIIGNLDKIHGLETAASTDPLTGLLNKSAAQKEIGERVKTAAGALLMFDLDSFKLVNDLYGHASGDKILIRFARLIKEIIRGNDLAGRTGGDEFIAFLQGVLDEKILHDKAAYANPVGHVNRRGVRSRRRHRLHHTLQEGRQRALQRQETRQARAGDFQRAQSRGTCDGRRTLATAHDFGRTQCRGGRISR